MYVTPLFPVIRIPVTRNSMTQHAMKNSGVIMFMTVVNDVGTPIRRSLYQIHKSNNFVTIVVSYFLISVFNTVCNCMNA